MLQKQLKKVLKKKKLLEIKAKLEAEGATVEIK